MSLKLRISKLTLGTAQLGMNYGIANITGKPDLDTAKKILKFSWKNGINTFDTSPAYGNSEKIIGSFIATVISDQIDNIIIISKLPRINRNEDRSKNDIYNIIKNQLKSSLKDLNLQKMPIYLLHHAPDIFFKNGLIIECLNNLKDEGLIGRIGISIYNQDEAEEALKFKEIDVIQVPINIFDQRLIRSRFLKRIKNRSYFIFARSIFLQGLFFIKPNNLPVNLKIATDLLIKLRHLSEKFNVDIAKLAFLFVRDLPQITSIVVGAETASQVGINLNLLNEKPLSIELNKIITEEFAEISEKIINPSFWNK